MSQTNNAFLSLFGWDNFYSAALADDIKNGWLPARVICEERNIYQVQFGLDETIWAGIDGKIQYNAKVRSDYPAVGDWVLIELRENSDRGSIRRIGPRKSTIYRKQISGSGDAQILSTNVDYVFITTSINEDLNLRRLERYLSMARDSGTSPVILLTKADLYSEEVAAIKAEIKSEFAGVPVHTLSKNEFEKAHFFSTYLAKGKTSVFVGSSGVGKSTIVNYLIGLDKIKTQEVRQNDGKGRHTTTSRNLYISRLGGLIIDTPGMRELALSEHTEGLDAEFADIISIFSNCKFTDCKHQSEPGCAIKAGLADESISQGRWDSYVKLEAEMRQVKRKSDKSLAAEDRKKWKKITVDARDRGRSKK